MRMMLNSNNFMNMKNYIIMEMEVDMIMEVATEVDMIMEVVTGVDMTTEVEMTMEKAMAKL